MKIQLLSDLHLEFYRNPHAFIADKVPKADADVLVLAGDVFSLRKHKRQALLDIIDHFYERAETLVYVPGNHEFYGMSVEEGLEVLETVVSKRVHLLSPREEDIWQGPKDERMLGGTLWFPRQEDNEYYESVVNDFTQIRGNFRDWAYSEHERTREFLDFNILPGDIVVTHHLPSMRSVPDLYKRSESNRFFVGDCEDIMRKRKPALWLHGHTHGFCDYVFDKTRIVCNPAGYPAMGMTSEEKTGWNPSLIIEI